MIEKIIEYAKENGFIKVYISSDMNGFYENYGVRIIDKLENYEG